MKILTKKNQSEIMRCADQVLSLLRSYVSDPAALGYGYDKISQIVKESHSKEDYLEWLMKNVLDSVDEKYNKY